MLRDRKNRWVSLALLLIIAIAGIYFWQMSQDRTVVDFNQSSNTNSITVKDCLDREVYIPDKVSRVACLYAFSGHVTAMLGQGDKIVAVPEGLKRDVLLNQIYPAIGDALVPSQSGSINIEELLKADPDVVFLQNSTAKNQAETEKLDKFKIPYLAVDFSNIQEQQYAIQVIGQVLGVPERAQAYNDYYNDCIKQVQTAVNNIPRDKRIRIYHSVNEATRTDTPATLPADWLQRCGVINVSLDQPLRLVEGKNYASLEQILLWNPEVILVNEPGVANYMLTQSQWASLTAVKENKVYQMPIGISRWGHPGGLETPLAMLWTAKLIYPQYFVDLDVKTEARTFYQRFFNHQVSDEMLDKILHGEGMRNAKGQQQ